MSAKSAMTNSVRSGGGSLRGNSLHEKLHATSSAEEKVMLAAEESKDRLYEPKRDKKMVRVLTVVVYVFSVSLAAIMLSLYYVFFWEPKGPHYVKPKVSPTNSSSTGATRAPLAPGTPRTPPTCPPPPSSEPGHPAITATAAPPGGPPSTAAPRAPSAASATIDKLLSTLSPNLTVTDDPTNFANVTLKRP